MERGEQRGRGSVKVNRVELKRKLVWCFEIEYMLLLVPFYLPHESTRLIFVYVHVQ